MSITLPFEPTSNLKCHKNIFYHLSAKESREEQSITATKVNSTTHVFERLDNKCFGEYFRRTWKNKHLEAIDGGQQERWKLQKSIVSEKKINFQSNKKNTKNSKKKSDEKFQ
jgi:hypothetical protein